MYFHIELNNFRNPRRPPSAARPHPTSAVAHSYALKTVHSDVWRKCAQRTL